MTTILKEDVLVWLKLPILLRRCCSLLSLFSLMPIELWRSLSNFPYLHLMVCRRIGSSVMPSLSPISAEALVCPRHRYHRRIISHETYYSSYLTVLMLKTVEFNKKGLYTNTTGWQLFTVLFVSKSKGLQPIPARTLAVAECYHRQQQ